MRVGTTTQRKIRSEKMIQKDIYRFLRKIGCSVDIITTMGFSRKGTADIIGCLPNGRFLAVEVKRPRLKPTELQKEWLDEKLRLGGVCFVAYSVEDAKDKLEKLWGLKLSGNI